MPAFFIDRPVFAWVIALFIAIAGLISLPLLPVAQYPNIAPPQISVTAIYPGASAEDSYRSVTRPIEDELNGVPGLIYAESASDTTGLIEIKATFRPGTSVRDASVEVQNRLRRIEPRLPRAVTDIGLTVDEATSAYLMVVSLTATDGVTSDIALGDYLVRNVIGELRRVEGVGKAQLFATQRAMRVWLDPDRLLGVRLTPSDVISAISAQNAQVAGGRIGSQPNPDGRRTAAPVLVRGLLGTAEEFGAIVLRANEDGSMVRLRDVARVEIGGEDYNFSTRLNGQPSAAIGVQLSATGNAIETSKAVRAKMEQLARFLPPGVRYEVPYDTTPFVEASIAKVVMTLVEAIALVVAMMFLFLQSVRYTLIPALVVPIALLGTSAVILAAGFSINVLTMFAMVLATGILVDDAIVVVENVERNMAEGGLPAREATRKAMSEVTGAIVGITLVLTAVFAPMAFFPGAVGVIYRQFSLTMAVSILLSGFLALSLTPALCASLLKRRPPGPHVRRGLFGWFNSGFDRLGHAYGRMAGGIVKRTGRVMVIYLILLAGLGWAFLRMPSGFLPTEDQGYLIVDVQAPPEASGARTLETVKRIEAIFLKEKAVARVIAISGFSFSGNGENAALAFVTLKDWSERGPNDSAEAIAARANVELFALKDALSFALSPPPIEGLGNTTGFTFRLQDRNEVGQAALVAAAEKLLADASGNPVLAGLRLEGLPSAPQLNLVIDREKANAFGIGFAEINAAVTASLGSVYVNDFPNVGRMQRVTVQSDARHRMGADDILRLNVRNAGGAMVPLSAFARAEWGRGAAQIVGYNGYRAIRIAGDAAPGHSSGQAIAEMERLAARLPAGVGYEWSGQSLQEIQSGSQAPLLVGLSILFVYLLLAARYESWSSPVAVLLVVPLGMIGSALAVMIAGLPNDIYFKVGLIAIIGLSAKNAILIVEFALALKAEGRTLAEATAEAARLRFRPIVMTSLAFALGVTPLAIAKGASAASQNAIGLAVLGGMISATLLALLFVPAFVQAALGKREPKQARDAAAAKSFT